MKIVLIDEDGKQKEYEVHTTIFEGNLHPNEYPKIENLKEMTYIIKGKLEDL